MTSRIDYDAVASTYDNQPYRSKQPDSLLLKFAEPFDGSIDVLDIACGTGNQLIANAGALPSARFVGVDASSGMLDVAREKAPEISWFHATAEKLPLDDDSFDYASCQFAYHHFRDLAAAFAEARRVVRDDGLYVLSNVSPHDYRNSLFYQLFPGAWERDSADFRSRADLEELLRVAGFSRVSIEREVMEKEQTLGEVLEYMSVRTNNSHLTAMSDEAHETGIERLKTLIEKHGADSAADNAAVLVRASCGAHSTGSSSG